VYIKYLTTTAEQLKTWYYKWRNVSVNVLVLNLLKVCKVSVSRNEKNAIVFTPRGLLASRTGEQCLTSCRWSLIMLMFLNLARVRGGDASNSQKMVIINIEWFKGSLIFFIPLQMVLSWSPVLAHVYDKLVSRRWSTTLTIACRVFICKRVILNIINTEMQAYI